MGAVLTTAASITCTHGGHVSLSSGSKLKVHGNQVLTQADVSGWSFIGCVPTKQGDSPCTSVSTIAPTASKLKAGGSPVILSGTASSNGSPPTLAESGSDSSLQAS